MRAQKTFLKLGNSDLRIGRTWIPAKQVPDALKRYARLVFCLNHSVQFPYSLRGTATAVRFRNRCMLFWCRHQTVGYPPNDVLVPMDREGKILISGSTFVQMIPQLPSHDEEFFDICGMQYVPDKYGDEATVERGFFDLIVADAWRGDPDSTFMVFGYPTSLRNVDYDKPGISVKQVVTSATYLSASRAASVHAIEVARTGNYSADGLSGSAVFHLGQDAQGFYCGFAGVVLRGSETSNHMHFLDVRVMLQFLNRA